MGHGDHERVERKRPPDGQPVPYRSRCQGASTAHSTHRQAVVPPATGVWSSDIAYPPDANTPSLRSQCPARSRSCPIIQSVTRRRPGPPHGPDTPHAAHRRRTALARQPAPGPHDNHPRRTAGSGSMPGTTPGAQQATEKTPKARDRTARTPTPACTPECQRQT
jgi:hypothetical protein